MRKNVNLGIVALTLVAAFVPAYCLAGTAVFQEGISDANGPNAAYDMEVGFMLEGFGGPLRAQDAFHQIGGLNGNWARVVLRWDVSTLAGKGPIVGARAMITYEPVVRAEGNAVVPDPFSYRLYRLADDNNQWIDAEVGRDQQRVGVPWKGSQGAGTPGVDYLTPAVAELSIAGGLDDTSKQVLTFELTDTSFLKDWVDNPANNAGFLLISEELEAEGADGNLDFVQGTMFPDDATDPAAAGRYPNAVPEDRPIFEVDYVPEPSGVVLAFLVCVLMTLFSNRARQHNTK